MTTATLASTTRPKWYDDKLVAYMPFIRKFANRAVRNSDSDDLAQEICASACAKWQSYNVDYGFGTWVRWMARDTLKNRRAYTAAQMRAAREVAVDADSHGLAVAPAQESSVDLSAVLSHLSETRSGAMLVRLAMGDFLPEIGADLGISKQRVKQLIDIERGRLRDCGLVA